jgi:hypothetical protein
MGMVGGARVNHCGTGGVDGRMTGLLEVGVLSQSRRLHEIAFLAFLRRVSSG